MAAEVANDAIDVAKTEGLYTPMKQTNPAKLRHHQNNIKHNQNNIKIQKSTIVNG